jgi:hypothetical protein
MYETSKYEIGSYPVASEIIRAVSDAEAIEKTVSLWSGTSEGSLFLFDADGHEVWHGFIDDGVVRF